MAKVERTDTNSICSVQTLKVFLVQRTPMVDGYKDRKSISVGVGESKEAGDIAENCSVACKSLFREIRQDSIKGGTSSAGNCDNIRESTGTADWVDTFLANNCYLLETKHRTTHERPPVVSQGCYVLESIRVF